MHELQFLHYPEKTDRIKIRTDVNKIVEQESDSGCCGEGDKIRFINRVFDSEDEACDYIQAVDNGWYDQIAVKYRHIDTKKVKYPKVFLAKKERLEKLERDYRIEADSNFFKNHKSKTIGCKKCGSRVSMTRAVLKEWDYNYCPVCHTDLRSPTFKKNMERKEATIKELKSELKKMEREIQQKYLKNAPIFWVVKIEYHV